jgi:hypothetical protein
MSFCFCLSPMMFHINKCLLASPKGPLSKPMLSETRVEIPVTGQALWPSVELTPTSEG